MPIVVLEGPSLMELWWEDKFVVPLDEPIKFHLLDDTPLVVRGKVFTCMSVAGAVNEVELYVADIPCDVLLGRDHIKGFGLVVDLSGNAYWSEKQTPCVKFPLVWVEKCQVIETPKYLGGSLNSELASSLGDPPSEQGDAVFELAGESQVDRSVTRDDKPIMKTPVM